MRYLIALVLMLNACLARASADELYRIRIQNKVGGLVQVSMDSGRSYASVGKVVTAANARITGFPASSFTPNGTVAAIATHGLRVKTGQSALGIEKAQAPLMFSIIPLEFACIPSGYGGHIPRSSGVLTDIYAGHSIFRNQSPHVGSPVYVERDHKMLPLPEDYIPVVGETFVIVVNRPSRIPSEIDFENRAGGNVTVLYPDGAAEVLAQVDKPVLGVGRYDGTTFTGTGAVNTNHGGVLTIGTAPISPPRTCEGGKVETRGGFMVQPYFHAYTQRETSPQVMIIGPKDRTKPALEGTPPLFGGSITLAWFANRPANSYGAQVRIDGGDWENLPKLTGKIDNAFTATYLTSYFSRVGKPRQVTAGVTAVRLVFPVYDAKLVAADLARESADYTARAIQAGARPQKGAVYLNPGCSVSSGSTVSYYIDGVSVYVSNSSPYGFEWDSRKMPNGYHTVDTEMESPSGDVVTRSRVVLIRN